MHLEDKQVKLQGGNQDINKDKRALKTEEEKQEQERKKRQRGKTKAKTSREEE